MRTRLGALCMCAVLAASAGKCPAKTAEALSPHVRFYHGPVNGVCIERNGHRLVVYGDPGRHWKTADTVLFTHGRRDVVWAGRALVDGGAEAVIPAAQAEQFTQADAFWASLWDKRFHDYAQQSTKVITASLRADRTVRQGDQVAWQGLTVQVLDTPGYARGAVSYFVDVDGIRYGFVGDLVYGDGRLLDLYSLQDAVPQTRIGGYHGYAGRIGDLIASLRRVAAQRSDILVPARGPVIRDPMAAIDRLIQRLQAAYANYLSMSAGRWYFREQYDILATRALGGAERVPWIPYAAVVENTPPDWIIPIHNSRLILAGDRSGFLIDCGSSAIIDEIRKLKNQGRLTSLDGLFVTHYHDDHTDKVGELLREHDCPVYVTPILADVLQRPGAYRLPAMTANPVRGLEVVPDGHTRRWKEFTLTFYDFPGQTIYHDALLVEREPGGKIFFIGDSFTPSGLDDYCLQNRNFLHAGTGYSYCLDILRNRVPPGALLINEHVPEPFRFSPDQLDHLRQVLARRAELLRDLFPWDAPDYGLDEQWARVYPYGQERRAGDRVELAVKLLNHSDAPRTFHVALNTPDGFTAEPNEASVTAAPGAETEAYFVVKVPPEAPRRVHVFTADIRVGPWDLRQWCEGLAKILPRPE